MKSKKWLRAAVVIFVAVWIVGLLGVAVARQNLQQASDVAPITGDPVVDGLFQRACYDCHSNATIWPLYSYAPGAGLLLAYDVLKGRNEFNFSQWSTLSAERRAEVLTESAEEVIEGEMPPKGYLFMHTAAHATQQERAALQRYGEGGEVGSHGNDEDDDDD